MPDEKIIIDGNIEFSGGMDTSREPDLLSENQYSNAVNIIIPRNSNRLRNRPGIHYQSLIGDVNDIDVYKNAKNVQASGYYTTGKSFTILKCVDGYVIEFKRIAEGTFKVRVLNRGDRNNPTRSKAWITRIPNGAIVNDGESLPFLVNDGAIRRTDPDNQEIGVGRMGIYVQNRFFYVTDNQKFIRASDFTRPWSIANSNNTNVHGFLLPEDEDVITAIGVQKASLNYIEGGVLSFSSNRNTYTVDVRGDRQNWETQDTNIGKVQETIPGIGAVSSYSYEPFNSNLWFRTIDFGIMSLKKSQYQFVNDDDYSSQSIEADYWFSNDSEPLLDKCYTVAYRNRLLTTIAPEINESGQTFWNGIVSMNPDPVYVDTKRPRRFESVFTGVRPWNLVVVRTNNKSELFIDSLDEDGVTRFYKMQEDSDYDINHRGQKVEIESWIETRGYIHGNFAYPKEPSRRYYTLSGLSRDVKIKAYSRTESQGEWAKFYDSEHKIKSCSVEKMRNGSFRFFPTAFRDQSRKMVNLPEEVSNSSCKNPSTLPGKRYYSRQDRIEIKGSFTLEHWLRESYLMPPEKNNKVCDREKHESRLVFTPIKDFTYSISRNS